MDHARGFFVNDTYATALFYPLPSGICVIVYSKLSEGVDTRKGENVNYVLESLFGEMC